jgi:hypothetical protein
MWRLLSQIIVARKIRGLLAKASKARTGHAKNGEASQHDFPKEGVNPNSER